VQLVIFLSIFNIPCIRPKIRCNGYYKKKLGVFELNMAYTCVQAAVGSLAYRYYSTADPDAGDAGRMHRRQAFFLDLYDAKYVRAC
jgi:hypothetical protein